MSGAIETICLNCVNCARHNIFSCVQFKYLTSNVENDVLVGNCRSPFPPPRACLPLHFCGTVKLWKGRPHVSSPWVRMYKVASFECQLEICLNGWLNTRQRTFIEQTVTEISDSYRHNLPLSIYLITSTSAGF